MPTRNSSVTDEYFDIEAGLTEGAQHSILQDSLKSELFGGGTEIESSNQFFRRIFLGLDRLIKKPKLGLHSGNPDLNLKERHAQSQTTNSHDQNSIYTLGSRIMNEWIGIAPPRKCSLMTEKVILKTTWPELDLALRREFSPMFSQFGCDWDAKWSQKAPTMYVITLLKQEKPTVGCDHLIHQSHDSLLHTVSILVSELMDFTTSQWFREGVGTSVHCDGRFGKNGQDHIG